ncbi:hypothetical protein [Photobacterium leiognathi]|uniref:hypothetical protein n=1 Tax=Photobacterium leiognathi TaxID=553611 RepID=UPI002982A34B|nr:hypothetical protein [Photobacterium leiognathi]
MKYIAFFYGLTFINDTGIAQLKSVFLLINIHRQCIRKNNIKTLVFFIFHANKNTYNGAHRNTTECLYISGLGEGCTVKNSLNFIGNSMTRIVNKIVALYTPAFSSLYKSGNNK